MQNLLEHRSRDWSQREMNSDRKLHDFIANGCGNARLTREIERYGTLMQAIRDVVGDRRQAQERAVEEHLVIINALLDEDPDRAAHAMARHIEYTAEVVSTTLFPPKREAPPS